MKKLILLSVLFTLVLVSSTIAYPLKFKDASGEEIILTKNPERVVSLVPSITETILRIGAEQSVIGITYHSTYPSTSAGKEIVGGYFNPSLERILSLKPDLVFVSARHDDIKRALNENHITAINMDIHSIKESYSNLKTLGSVFGKPDEARKILEKNLRELEIIKNKTDLIPEKDKKRVLRLIGRDTIMIPGDNSFQKELIELAGGIPVKIGRDGGVLEITKEEWVTFNPQLIYGCGGDTQAAQHLFKREGWKDVDAVRNNNIRYFPCDLTCRASTNIGTFVSWLSATIYGEEFSKKKDLILKDETIRETPLHIELDYIKKSHIAETYIDDFINKTLIIEFKKPLSILSTLEGFRENIVFAGNHYTPPPCWGLAHKAGLDDFRDRINQAIDKQELESSFLYTGANMDNITVIQKSYKDIDVYALVTAGVRGNAMRMSRDTGLYYEPGTINILILTNTELTERAMSRAVITATESKTAAFTDMDIRSSYSPQMWQATGTGTDNILVVQGEGIRIDSSGGHTKMGELIAKAVYDGVRGAVYKQNGLIGKRNIFQRLKERKLTAFGLASLESCDCDLNKTRFREHFENLLMTPRYASFIETAFSVSDAWERGLIQDLEIFKDMSCKVSGEIAGREVSIQDREDFIDTSDIPEPLEHALNSLLNGIFYLFQETGR